MAYITAETPALACPSARAASRPGTVPGRSTGGPPRPEELAILGSPALTDGPGCKERDKALPGVARALPGAVASANRKHGYRHSPVPA